MELIDKNALVAEIERRLSLISQNTNAYEEGRKRTYMAVLYLIDTLEVKEVDLEKELESWRHNHFHGRRDKEANGEYLKRISQLELAKHFFELGLSSQLSWQDVKRLAEIGETFMNSEESDNLSEEEYYTEILNKFKVQKGE